MTDETIILEDEPIDDDTIEDEPVEEPTEEGA